MSKLHTATPEQLQQLKSKAAACFGPLVLHEALLRLCQARGSDGLAAFEKSMVRRIEAAQNEQADYESIKELGIEQLYAWIREVKASRT
ncbi:hypothetical protein [Mesorhizobium sp. B2-1-3A]|uniref:hypothetical protein n=1 Tax=Mesorhizobium sp. B2-1-3A TaxID=2589971 RepID=UPI001FEF6D11|nr:hypothetical protein [Mesorhizobium sp. B2-1-3A]